LDATDSAIDAGEADLVPADLDGVVEGHGEIPEPVAPAEGDLSAERPPPDDIEPVPMPDIGLDDGTAPWRALLAEAARTLAATGSEHAEIEARRIVEEATGHDGAALLAHLDDPATVGGVAALDRMVERRLAGEPLQYVLGRWSFRTLDLMVDDRVLIPRPETEGVVDHVLAELDRIVARGADDGPAAPPVVVDLGCGSGAIGLAVAVERRSTPVHSVDVAPGAVEVTRANLAGLGVAGASVTVHQGSWFEPLPPTLAGRVAVVAANPPYVADAEALPPEVADWEPTEALVPGPTGLEAIEAILVEAPTWLAPGGAVVLEIGEAQGDAVRALAAAAGLVDVQVRPDLNGRDRALVARRPGTDR